MIIHVYTICWNEEVRIPYFLRHYLSFAGKVVIYDNMSTDRSVSITRSYPNAEIRPYDTNNEIRDDVYLEIKNNAWKDSRGTADFVIVCDIDEFLYYPNLPDFITTNQHYTVFPSTGYDLFTNHLPEWEGMLYDKAKIGIRNSLEDKCVMFNPNEIQEINYTPGCHSYSPTGIVRYCRTQPGLKLLHYKYLSLDYVLHRNRLLADRLSVSNKAQNWGIHYLYPDEYYIDYYNRILTEGVNIVD